MDSSVFVGREAALQLLHEQLNLVRSESPRLLLISAPAGMGKTALVQHFLDEIAGRDIRQGTGRGWDNSAAVPYHPLREALRSFLSPDEATAEGTEAFLDGEIRNQTDALHPQSLFPVLAAALRARVEREPACLFLDDLQWADEGTFDWLDYAYRELEGVPMLWIGAYRSEEASSVETLLQRRHRWLSAGRFCECRLDPLTRAEVEELVRLTAPEEQGTRLAARIWERSGGLPLLAREEIQIWKEGRRETPQGQALIAHRLSRLVEEDRQTLEVAAVIGERFEVGPLAIALEQDEITVGRRLERLRREQSLLEEHGSGYRFVHSRFREGLLDDLSQAMQRIYHARLARQKEVLLPAQRTYHLAHSGDVRQGVQALLLEGDQTRIQMAWKDALRYYVEALWLVQGEAHAEASLFLEIYMRLGDVQLVAARQTVVARSYYEAARTWARTPRDQALLLCRLAETCRDLSPERRRYLEEAAQQLREVDDPGLRSWVEFRQVASNVELGNAEWPRIDQLCKQVKGVPDLPRELLEYAEEWSLKAARMTGEQQECETLRSRLEALPANSWPAARCHEMLARACFRQPRDVEQGLHHIRAASRIAGDLGRTAESIDLYSQEFSILAGEGRYREVRALVRERLRDVAPGDILEMLYGYLCHGWIFERTGEGVEWATRYLRGLESFFVQFPTDGGHLRKLLRLLGEVEHIFLVAGREDAFRQRIRELRERLRQVGYRTEGVWFFEERVEREGLEPIFPADVKGWMREEKPGWIHYDGETVCCRRSPADGLTLMKMPRLRRALRGGFALQMTAQDGEAVLESALQAQHRIETGQPLSYFVGGGGIFVVVDPQNWLRLTAHSNFPGQVQFDLCQEGWSRTLGRGLFAEGSVHLRLERRGTRFCACAGGAGGVWYDCGEVDLPEWDAVDVGIFGEGFAPLHPGVPESIEFRCREIGFEVEEPPVISAEAHDELYDLPRPAIVPEFPAMVAASSPMQRIIAHLRQSRHSSLPVLIQGETGTGKELVAQAVYRLSSRSSGPFVPVNCGAIAPSLLEAELFGHVRGAYTGAKDTHGGLFEVAHRGVLFLDEIGEASLSFQVHLLRVIEEQAVRRVGDQKLHRIDVLFVTATNRDLLAAVEEGAFRQDLYYRLQGLEIHVPPLRERREDIPHLVAFFLDKWAEREELLAGITKGAMEVLMDYSWPGNVRELFHVAERAAAIAEEGVIAPAHLSIPGARKPARQESSKDEYQRIAAVLHATGGNVSAAARRLRVSRTTMYRKMRRLGFK